MIIIKPILYAFLLLYAALTYSHEPFFFRPELGVHQFLNFNSKIQRGRDIWLNNTYGGEKFFAFLATHPDPTKRIRVGFENIVATPRNQRFQQWGTINDPDCRANPSGGPDLCADPNATGVIGIRKFPGSKGTTLYGVSCASCHVGFDPLHPPADVNEPAWKNIHLTIGNQYLKSGKIIVANLPPNDPRRLMFEAWPDGSVDTTALFTDNIMNPSVITQIWDLRRRLTFDVGLGQPKLRMGHGGEDDLGLDIAATRVYTNLGVCFAECVAPRSDRPDATAPINLEQCRNDCADLPPKTDIDNLGKFLLSAKAPQFPAYPTNYRLYIQGRRLFQDNCASCHTTKGKGGRVLSNDAVNPLVTDPDNATNACRALTNQWEADRLWAEFSSHVYKDRALTGLKGYRTKPLSGVWATAPLLHNQSIGPYAPANATPLQLGAAYEAAMQELLAANRTPKVNRLPAAVGPFPAGTPLTFVFSRDPTGKLLCNDSIENRGHHYGSALFDEEKKALIYWLKQQ